MSADIERTSDMRRLLALLAAQTGGLLNLSRLGSELSISTPTVRNYVEIGVRSRFNRGASGRSTAMLMA